MSTENVLFDFDGLLGEIQSRAKEEGVATREAYENIINDVMDEKSTFGELHDDNELVEIKEQLLTTWEEFNRG